LFLGESEGQNRGHGFNEDELFAREEREVVICCELILSGVVNGFFFTIRFITLYIGICGLYGSRKEQFFA
jgi:hypothetical protein